MIRACLTTPQHCCMAAEGNSTYKDFDCGEVNLVCPFPFELAEDSAAVWLLGYVLDTEPDPFGLGTTQVGQVNLYLAFRNVQVVIFFLERGEKKDNKESLNAAGNKTIPQRSSEGAVGAPSFPTHIDLQLQVRVQLGVQLVVNEDWVRVVVQLDTRYEGGLHS